ncbi:hypothetical protein [Methanobrevibacter sp. DSM 116169]|uniref:hypothetical protein n=1 Tax=Methanobrevibacter sp. DSM 116169 TaxID=3242727 RepID=UPI0038FCF4F7
MFSFISILSGDSLIFSIKISFLVLSLALDFFFEVDLASVLLSTFSSLEVISLFSTITSSLIATSPILTSS